jgi:hypothetical protein
MECRDQMKDQMQSMRLPLTSLPMMDRSEVSDCKM